MTFFTHTANMTQTDQNNLTENALIQAALNGEEEAFIRLYRQHVSALYRFVYSKLNNQQDAEDIASETFYHALKNLRNFSGKSTFKNWLYGIAKHLVLAKYRERYNESTLELNENAAAAAATGALEEPAISENSSGQDGEDEAQEEENQRLEAILNQLPEHYRKVLELRFLKGYSIAETAAAMDITEENAKVLQHRALKKANRLQREHPE